MPTSGTGKRLLVLTTAHPFGDKRVFHKFVRSFLDHGVDVTWAGPSPAVVPGDVESQGIHFLWAPPILGKKDRLLSRWRMNGILKDHVGTYDWIYCPDPDGVPLGLKLRGRTGAKVIFDIHEVFHETHLGHWLKTEKDLGVGRFIKSFISRYARQADWALGVSDGVMEAYASGLPHALTLRNCPPAWFGQDSLEEAPPASPGFRVMHGLIGPNRGTRELITEMSRYGGEHGLIELVCFGEKASMAALGLDPDRLMAGEGGHFRVDLKDPVAYETMPGYLRECRAGAISYTGAMSGPNLANRVFEYMATGLPVLAPAQSPEIVNVVERAKSGLVYDLGRPGSFLETVKILMGDSALCDDLGNNGRAAFKTEYSWEGQFSQLAQQLGLGGQSPSPL